MIATVFDSDVKFNFRLRASNLLIAAYPT